jgi:hypothetical protein
MSIVYLLYLHNCIRYWGSTVNKVKSLFSQNIYSNGMETKGKDTFMESVMSISRVLLWVYLFIFIGTY